MEYTPNSNDEVEDLFYLLEDVKVKNHLYSKESFS